MIVAVSGPPACAQERKMEIFGGFQFQSNIASAAIDAYDGSTQCGIFTSGNKTVPSFFGGLSVPFGNDFSLVGRLSYDNLSTQLNNVDSTINKNSILAYNLFNNAYESVTRTRQYNAAVGMLTGAVELSYYPISKFAISAGPFLGYLIQHSYSETEQLTTPSNAVYAENNLSTRTIYNTTSINAAHLLQFGIALSASYELPFEPHLALRPSIEGMIPFTQISSQSSNALREYAVGGALAIVYHFEDLFAKETPNEIATHSEHIVLPHIESARSAVPVPIVPPQKTVLSVSVKALGIEKNGKEVSEPVISIERAHVTEVYPMLHYVFFDDGSAEIPSRYDLSTADSKTSFNEKKLFSANAFEIHHHVLDILGKRLTEHPDANITLVGTRSEHSEGDSTAGTSISLDRAKSVQHYLSNIWGISQNRIHLRARTLPEAASDDYNSFGQAENRRVEIIPSTAEITAPLWTERIERIATPPQIDFDPEITANAGIRSATISVYQHGRLLYKIDALDSVSHQYNWTIDQHSMPDDAGEDSLRYVFTAIDSLDDTAESAGVIHLKKEMRDTSLHAKDTMAGRQLDRYSLILFDYSSSSLDKKESEAIVHDMASVIKNNSDITLTGHTDKTGDDAFNDKLARQRVDRATEMLEAALKQLRKSHEPIMSESHGSRDELFDNRFPEGRVLSRTVRAQIDNGGQ